MEQNAAKAVALLKAMANQHRLMILCVLLQQELSVSALNEQIPLGQSALSQHLAWLRKAGFVSTRREAKTIYYSLSSTEVKQVIALLHQMYCQPAASQE